MSGQSTAAPKTPEAHSTCKPFVKWAGGKRQLLKQLCSRLPKTYKGFFEPFIGGGALFFHLRPDNAVILDINPELINTYRVIQKNVEELIGELSHFDNSEEFFYATRNVDRMSSYSDWGPAKKAARFIYLNKTAFNGLWRVNSKGQHNVPYGRYTNPNICDSDNLRACSVTLQSTTILLGNYRDIANRVSAGDFVYFDPPYHPLNETSNFTSYTKNRFSAEDQKELKNFIDELTEKRVQVMLSNSSSPFIIDLFKDDYNVELVDANRSINSKGTGRGSVKEVIVRNYE